MANFLNQAKSQFSSIQGTVSSIQGTVTDTFSHVKSEAGESAGKVSTQIREMFHSAAPQAQAVDNTTRDFQAEAEQSVSSAADTAKTQGNKLVEFFAGIFEKCCAPFNKKKE